MRSSKEDGFRGSIIKKGTDAYFRRIASGIVYGERTNDLFAVTSSVDQTRVEMNRYLGNIEIGIESLGVIFNLRQQYDKKQFTAIKEKTMKFAFTYGIVPTFFEDHQRGLFLMGLASNSVNLKKVQGPLRKKEEERINHAIKMVAID
jgi:hypothetical protein